MVVYVVSGLTTKRVVVIFSLILFCNVQMMSSFWCRCLVVRSVILENCNERCEPFCSSCVCFLCRSLWLIVTLRSQSAFCLKNRLSFIHTSLVLLLLFYGFCFHENFCCTTAQQNIASWFKHSIWEKRRDFTFVDGDVLQHFDRTDTGRKFSFFLLVLCLSLTLRILCVR